MTGPEFRMLMQRLDRVDDAIIATRKELNAVDKAINSTKEAIMVKIHELDLRLGEAELKMTALPCLGHTDDITVLKGKVDNYLSWRSVIVAIGTGALLWLAAYYGPKIVPFIE